MKKAVPAGLFLTVLWACAPASDCIQGSIYDEGGEQQVWAGCIERAETAEERIQGLIGHPPLPESEAMLLVFPQSSKVCIHNEGVTFPIDVVFLDEEKVVQMVIGNIPANSTNQSCRDNTRYVLELAAGQATYWLPGYRLQL